MVSEFAELSKEQLIRLLEATQTRNAELTQENQGLKMEVQVRRTMKARSPAEWRFRVVSWELGEQLIYPTEFPQGKVVPNLRIHIPLDDPSEGAPYWDITSKKLIALLLPFLPKIAGSNTYVEVTKSGDGFASAYSIVLRPA